MIKVIQVLCLLAVAALSQAKPQYQNQNVKPNATIPIVTQTQEGPNPDGSYQYSFKTGNGIEAQEKGYLENPGTPQESRVAYGSYKFYDGGRLIDLVYSADKNGFQPSGDHLPTPPPIPKEIARALEFLKTVPKNKDNDWR